LLVIALVSSFLQIVPLLAKDARELEQEQTASKKLKGEHTLIELMRTRKSEESINIRSLRDPVIWSGTRR